MKLKILMILTLICFYAMICSFIVTYQYDDMNRVISIDYGDGYTITYNYDELGNRTSMIIQGSDQTPSAPINVQIKIVGNDVEITWDEVIGANSYKIYGSVNPEGPFEDISNSGIFGTDSRVFSQIQINSSRNQNLQKAHNEGSEEIRSRQTWTCDISEIDKRFFYVIASTEERNIIHPTGKKSLFKKSKYGVKN